MLDGRGLFPLKIALAKTQAPAAGGLASAGGSRAGTSPPSTRNWPTCCTPACRCLRSLEILERQSTNPTLQSVLRDVASRSPTAPGWRGDGRAPACVQRAGRQHGPRRPGGRLPRRRAQAHRRLRRAPGRPEGEGRSARWPTRCSWPSPASRSLNILMIFFVPKFEPIFEKLKEKGELPALTQLPDGFSHFISGYWWAWPLIVVDRRRSSRFRRWTRRRDGRADGRSREDPAAAVRADLPEPGAVAVLPHPRHDAAQRHPDPEGARTSPRTRPATRCWPPAIEKSAENVTAGQKLADPLRKCELLPAPTWSR